MGEESSLFSFFFYVLFVYPACNWILKPGRFSRSKGLTYAIGLLVAISAVKTGLELQERGPNFYQMLDVTRGSSAVDIKRAYKRMSLELHPDKNPSPTAIDDFAALKNGYDVLMDMETREIYNRFGEDKVKSKLVIDEYRVLLEVAIFYVAWGIMTYMLTLGKQSSNARQWAFTGMIAMLVVEVMLLLKELTLPDWFLPQMTEHELVMLGHNLFPAYLNGCRCIGAYLFVDLDEHARRLLLALHEQNKEVLRALADLQQTIAANGGVGGAAAPPTVNQTLQNLEASLRGGAVPAHPAANIMKPDAGKSNTNLYLMIAGYVVLYYVFSGG